MTTLSILAVKLKIAVKMSATNGALVTNRSVHSWSTLSRFSRKAYVVDASS